MNESAAVRMHAASSGSSRPFVSTLSKAEPSARPTIANDSRAYAKGSTQSKIGKTKFSSMCLCSRGSLLAPRSCTTW